MRDHAIDFKTQGNPDPGLLCILRSCLRAPRGHLGEVHICDHCVLSVHVLSILTFSEAQKQQATTVELRLGTG